MFGTIRKHQTWLWAIIITVIIISFVWFFSPYTKMHDSGGRSVNFGSIYGRKITEENFIHARRVIEAFPGVGDDRASGEFQKELAGVRTHPRAFAR